MTDDGYGVEAPDEDDYAGMLAALEARLDRSTVARAIGAKESELDLIAIGHAPKPESGERLRMLYAWAKRTDGDLRDPRALLEAAGLPAAESGPAIPIALVPRLKAFLIAFVAVDALVFGAVLVLFFVLRD